MNADEAFEKWWDDRYGNAHPCTNHGRQAWLEATRQAYLHAASICDLHGSDDAAEAIRQRLKEYDNV